MKANKIWAVIAVAAMVATVAYAARPRPTTINAKADGEGSATALVGTGLNYSTGFEAAEGFVLGHIKNQPAGCGGLLFPCWGVTGAANASLVEGHVAAVHPFAGDQHLRLSYDPATRTNQPNWGLGVDSRYPRTADLQLQPVAPSTAMAEIAISNILGMTFKFQPQSNTQGFWMSQIVFDYYGGIYVVDNMCGAIGLSAIPVGTMWDGTGAYHQVMVLQDPCQDTMSYHYAGNQIYPACILRCTASNNASIVGNLCAQNMDCDDPTDPNWPAGDGVCSSACIGGHNDMAACTTTPDCGVACVTNGSELEQVLVYGDNFQGSDFDMDNLVTVGSPDQCPAVCGNGRIDPGSTEQCDPGVPGVPCNLGHTCDPVTCLCDNICTLNEPCILTNGENGPFTGPFDALYGGIFLYYSDGVPAVSVETCGSSGFDTRIFTFYNYLDANDLGAANDDCCDPNDPNCGTYGVGSDPGASCYNNLTPGVYESCVCNPVAVNPAAFLLQTNTPGAGDELWLTVNKKAACAGAHLGACCDTNGEGAGVCTDNVVAADCIGADKVWTENGKCADLVCECIPMCEGKHCGPDGCGGVCPDVPPCDDGLACNGVEGCDDQTGLCTAGTPVVCDDGLACTGVEVCEEPNGTCTNPPDVVCDDGLGCNGVEVCLEPDGTCSNPPDVVCPNDNNVCNGPEYCLDPAGTCVSGPALNCPDNGIFCDGEESCDPIAGCVSSGNPCQPGEECNETDHCFVPPIPTVSEWGIVILTLLLLTGAKIYFSRRQAIA